MALVAPKTSPNKENPRPSIPRTSRRRFNFDLSPDDKKKTLRLSINSPKDYRSPENPSISPRQKTSPLSSPKSNLATPSYLNIELKRLKTGELDDDAVYTALEKINGILQHQQSMKEKSKRGSELAREGTISPVVQKNLQILRRVQKYQNDRGMGIQSKEKKFDNSLKTFKKLKTFINMQEVMQDLSDPVKCPPLKINDESPVSLYRIKDQLRSPQQGNNDAYSFGETGVDMQSQSLSPRKRKPFKLKLKLQPLEEEDAEEGQRKDMQEMFEENIKDQLGMEAFKSIRTNMSNPKKQREVRQKMNLKLVEMRKVRNELRDTGLFNSLLDHLSIQTIEEARKGAEDEDGQPESPFFKKFEKDVIREYENAKKPRDDEEEDEGFAAYYDSQRENLAQKMHYDVMEIPGSVERSSPVIDLRALEANDIENDSQVKAVTLLSSYRERSKKVLSLLKKKASTIHKKSLMEYRNSRSDVQGFKSKQLDSPTNLHRNLVSVSSGQTNSTAGGEQGKGDERESVGSKRALHAILSVNQEEPSVELQTPFSGPNADKFRKKVLENRKRYMQLNQRRLVELEYSPSVKTDRVESVASPRGGKDLGTRRYLSRATERSGEGGRIKEPQKSYERSLEGIKGMISDLSLTNRGLESEIRESTRDVETFYSQKISLMKPSRLPESLRFVPKIDYTKKKTSIIMKLASKVLRDQIL